MAIASGLGSQFGYIKEASGYAGTWAAPTRFLEISKENLEKKKNVVQGAGLYGNKLGNRSSRRVVPNAWVEGSISLDVPTRGIGQLLAALMGGTDTTAAIPTNAGFTHSIVLGDPVGQSFSLQAGLPTVSGTPYVKSVRGAKVTGGSFACKADGLLTADLSFDGRLYDEAQGLATATYPTASLFHGGQMSVRLGTGALGTEASVSGVNSVSVKIDRPHNTKRFYAGASGLKAEPIINGPAAITGSLEVDLVNVGDFVTRFVNDTPLNLVWEFLGNPLPGASPVVAETFRLTLPGVSFDTGTPTIEGADIISPTVGFTWNYDGTNLPKLELATAESAVWAPLP